MVAPDIATEALRESPPLFTLDPPPLIALKRRLIVNRMSTALLVFACPAITGGAAGPTNPEASVFEVLLACDGSRSTASEASANVRIGSSAADRIEVPVDLP